MSAAANSGSFSTAHTRDNTLAENYDVHDVGLQYVTWRLDWYGFDAIEVGKDDRHSDEDVTFGVKPDLRVHDADSGLLVGYVEVKTKRSEYSDWAGKLNDDHWDHYCHGGVTSDEEFVGARNLSVPVWVWMSVIDDTHGIVEGEFTIRVEGEDQIARRFDHNGKLVAVVDEDEYRTWHDLIESFSRD